MQKEYVFIARGIGITPFRSMIRSLLDTNDKRKITLFYSAKSEDEFLFKDVLEKAEMQLGLQAIFIVNNKGNFLDEKRIKKHINDREHALFYVSGPQEIVESVRDQLQSLGAKKIKTDLFTGYEQLETQ